jgi:hypothetical protein
MRGPEPEARTNRRKLLSLFRDVSDNGLVTLQQAREIATELGINPDEGFDHVCGLYRSDVNRISHQGIKLSLFELDALHEKIKKMDAAIEEAAPAHGILSLSQKVGVMLPFFPGESHERLIELVTTWSHIARRDVIELMLPRPFMEY